MNEVGRIRGDILSVFGYIFTKSHPSVLILNKNEMNISGYSETSYGVAQFSIIKEDGGLYIQSFKDDRVMIMGLDDCIDGGTDYLGNKQVCKYKDAASVKKFFDSWKKH